MIKQSLRKIYLQKRLELSPAVYSALNHKILHQFKQLDLSRIGFIHFYLPIPLKNEPDTALLINWLKISHPQIKTVFAKANFRDHTMQHFLDDEALKIATNAFNIPEPVEGNEVDVKDIDMVIVPLLAFDMHGYRVGYGKGFYDRFLASCKPGTCFTGITFFDPVNAIDYVDAYDIRLTRCITPGRVYEF